MIRKLTAAESETKLSPNSSETSTETAKPVRKRVACAIALLGGAAFGVGWLDESLGWLALLGVAAFMWLHLSNSYSRRLHFLFGWLHGVAAFSVATSWVPFSVGYLLDSTMWSIPVAAIVWSYLALQYALIGLAISILKRRASRAWLAVPAVWLSVLIYFPNLFPFLPACLLTGQESLLQLAEIGGVYLVSVYALAIAGFVAWSLNGALTFCRQGILVGGGLKPRAFALAALFAIYIWGDARMNSLERSYLANGNEVLNVGMVQAATQFDVSHQRIVEAANSMGGIVDLMIWPENSLGNYSTELTDFSDATKVFENSRREGFRYQPWPNQLAPLLAGADTWQPGNEVDTKNDVDARFVSAMLIGKNQQLLARRHKTKLMPFGEYMPGESWFPAIGQWVNNGPLIVPGRENKPMTEIDGVSIATLLCCEDMHPAVAAEQINNGGNLLVTLGNNVVFNSNTVGRQHFRIAQFRAIENRVPMLRCMTTGRSGLLSPSGKVHIQLSEGGDTAAVIPVPKMKKSTTIFQRFGVWLTVSILTMAFVAAFVGKSIDEQT